MAVFSPPVLPAGVPEDWIVMVSKGKSPFSRWLKLGLEWNDARTRENEMDIRPRGGFFTSHADSRNKGASKNRIGHGQVLDFQGPPVDGI